MPSIISAGTTTGTALSLTSDTSGELQIRTNNGSTTAMTLTTGGNVGVGTTTPGGKLGVDGSVVVGNQAASGTAGTFGIAAVGGAVYLQTGQNTTSASAAPLVFTNYGAASEWMRITSAGNVGIGTSSPQGKFVASNSGANGFEVQPDAVSGTETRINSYNRSSAAFTSIGINASQHYWLTSSTERMRIDSSGNVFIGKTSDSDAAQGLSFYPAGAISYNDNNSGDRTPISFRRSGTLVGRIETNANNTSYLTTSSSSTGAALVNAGISFPSTQVASGGANTLDDYEEGSWNGTVSDGTNNATMATNGGSYTKVGNLVTVTGYFACSNKGSLSGSLRVTGLPFTVFNGTAAYAGQAFGYTGGANITAGQNIGGYAEYNQTYIVLTYWSSSIGTAGLPTSAINNNFDFIISLTYRTN